MGAQSIKRRFWMSLFIEKAKFPDMTVKQFCNQKNVTEKSYWYFHKALADELEKALSRKDDLPGFLELRSENLLTVSEDSDQQEMVEISSLNRNINIRIGNNISDEFLIRIMRALDNV